MDDDLTRDVGAPLAGDDDEDVAPEENEDDLDDNFDRELREVERELEEVDPQPDKPRKKIKPIDLDE